MLQAPVGIFLILLGFLVKRFPNLIAGYNTMSAEQKAQVDVDGLSTHMRNSLVVIGSLMLTIAGLNNYLGLGLNRAIVFLTIVMPGILYMVVKTQSYMKSEQKKGYSKSLIVAVSILLFTSVLVVALILYGSRSTEFLVQDNQLEIKGMYGMTTEIRKVEQMEVLPPTLMKTNGYSLAVTKKGNFKLEGIGKCKLYLESSTGPFIYFESTDGTRVIINTKSDAETKKLYVELQKISR